MIALEIGLISTLFNRGRNENCTCFFASAMFLFANGPMGIAPTSAAGAYTIPPTVVSTFPVNGDQAVESGAMVMKVTFSEPMKKGHQSWAQATTESFPKVDGMPALDETGTVATLPVILKPNTEYVVFINTKDLDGFRDRAGNQATPYKLTFKTK